MPPAPSAVYGAAMQVFQVIIYPPFTGATPYRWVISVEGKAVNAGVSATMNQAIKDSAAALKTAADALPA